MSPPELSTDSNMAHPRAKLSIEIYSGNVREKCMYQYRQPVAALTFIWPCCCPSFVATRQCRQPFTALSLRSNVCVAEQVLVDGH